MFFLQFPASEEEWKKIAREFEIKWNFPHCLGAIDGKHIRINAPPNSGSNYYCYKDYFSTVLMAAVDANYEFIMVDAGANGRISDGGVISNTKFYKLLKDGLLKIPPPEKTGISEDFLHYVFVGDEAFALRADFMKPYCSKSLNHDRKIFNYRLSRARRIVENAFGILANRFRVFHTPISIQSVDNIKSVIMASCVLHNYLMRESPNTYLTTQDIDRENFEEGTLNSGLRADMLSNVTSNVHTNSSNQAKLVREKFEKYFNNEGAVPWQENMIT